MQTITLNAQKRNITGRKVKQLRKRGLIPGSIYGKGVSGMAIELNFDAFEAAYNQAGYTKLLQLVVDGQKKPALIKIVQRDALKNLPLHVDFHQVDLTEKVTANIPLKLIGEAPAVKDNLGALLPQADEVEVEALPADLPEAIEVDIQSLAAIGDTIKVGDLQVPAGVTILTAGDQIVVHIGELVTPEAEPEVAAAPAEGEAEEVAAEGEKSEGSKTTEAPTPKE